MRTLLTSSLLLLSLPAVAVEFDVSGKISTLGIGVEVSKPLPANFALRAGVNTLNYEYDDTINEIDYESDLKLRSVAGYLDWRPFASPFRLTGGLVYNQNEITGVGAADGTYTLDGVTFNAADVGTLSGNVGFDTVAPYVGLGFNVPVAPTFRISFDAGVLFQGEPQVDLSADGAIASDPRFIQALEAEERDFQEEVEDFELFPVLSIGLSKRF
ncbi:MAG: hypothetical protein AAGD86_11180 [Pseudomonadota bacterium]